MKKSLLTAIAVATLGLGAAAHADAIDSVGNTLSRIFNVPYDPTPPNAVPAVRIDQYGSYRDQWGRTVYLDANRQPLYIEQNGQLIPYGSNYAVAPRRDSDGDGVPNRYDRAPLDARYRY